MNERTNERLDEKQSSESVQSFFGFTCTHHIILSIAFKTGMRKIKPKCPFYIHINRRTAYTDTHTHTRAQCVPNKTDTKLTLIVLNRNCQAVATLKD